MIRNLVIITAILAVILGYTFYTERADNARRYDQAKETDSATEIIALRQDAPDFSFESLNGTKYKLSDLADKTVILNFWASWCAPCVIEYPMMLRLADMVKNDAVFLFLSVDESVKDIENFLTRHGDNIDRANVLIAHDDGKKISQGLYHSYKLPETYIIAPGTIIIEKIIGADVEWDSQKMAHKIRALVAKKSP